MTLLGFWYRNGLKGLPKEVAQAFAWFKWAADLDHPGVVCAGGARYVDGRGVECNVTYGFVMIGRAAELGSETACYNLGKWHRSGINGFPKDEAQARKWFRKMETCEHKDCPGQYREKSAEWLRAHPERS